MAQIGGQLAPENDNNPVEVRRRQIFPGPLNDALGRFPTTRIRYRWLVGTGYIHWQYFPHGIIISAPDTCASVVYGPIYNYWDATGQFDGPLGAPTTDVLRLPTPTTPGLPPPPPRGSYAAFERGVLYLDPDIGASVVELSPVPPNLVSSGANVTPTGDGIAQAAKQVIDAFIADALAAGGSLAENVSAIRSRVTFRATGPGGCAGAGFDAVGRSLLRSHILNVHLDFDLKGCAGTFGSATADLRVEVRLFINPPTVAARLVNYWIDAVSSPFGAGDQDIREHLTRALNGQFGRDLLNRTLPSGITVLAGIVLPNGDVNLYIEPICASTALMRERGGVGAEGVLDEMRGLRDRLGDRLWGQEVVDLVNLFAPVVTDALARQDDAAELEAKLAGLLARTFGEGADLDAITDRLREPAAEISQLLAQPELRRDPAAAERLADRAVTFVRERLRDDVGLGEVLSEGRRMIDDEIRHCRAHRRADGAAR